MFKELPKSSPGLTFNNRGANTHWGKPEVIKALINIGKAWDAEPPISVGHISRQQGGKFPPHNTHRNGDDVDIRPMRTDGRNMPVEWSHSSYSRALTRNMIKTILANAPIKNILFNDPKLIREGLCIYYVAHSDHLHVNFAEARTFPTLRRGDKGAEVRLLQEKLHVKIDGNFGPDTEHAVREFQAHHGLSVDGIAGKDTLDLLFK